MILIELLYVLLKSRFSESARKFEISRLLVNVKSEWVMFSNFVVPSEYIDFMSNNFTYIHALCFISNDF